MTTEIDCGTSMIGVSVFGSDGAAAGDKAVYRPPFGLAMHINRIK
jgi:hypothetical protein